MRDDSTEIIFHSFLRKTIVSSSGMDRDVHYLMAKTILQGTVKGERRRGRQRKRWEDSIRKWTGLEFAKSQRAVENRGKWRKLAEKSSMMPQEGRDDDDDPAFPLVAEECAAVA